MSKDTFGMGLVLGALSGAVAAYLFAPKSGKELREELSVKGNEAKRKTIEATDEAVSSTEQWIDEKINEQEQKTKDYAAKTKDHEAIEVRPKEDVVEESYRNL